MAINKKDGRKISRAALEHFRMRAIVLWKNGKKVFEIAENFGVSLTAVYNWINLFKKKGYDGLKMRKATGAAPKLTYTEINKLLKFLEKTADQYGFDTPLWDCKRIQQLIREKFRKVIHISNVWRLLNRFGLSPQKPERRATQREEGIVDQWIMEIWPKIKAHARRWQAVIYFQDESAVQLTAVLGKTWAPKGKTPIIRVTGNRGCIVITSAISPGGRMLFRFEKQKIKAKQHIEFLKQVLQHHPKRKIIIVEDQARPHIAKEVEKFVEQNKRKLAVYYLPSYSPELNPDEHVWAHLKKNELKAHQEKTMEEFRTLVLSKMRSIQRKRGRVKSFFYGPLFN